MATAITPAMLAVVLKELKPLLDKVPAEQKPIALKDQQVLAKAIIAAVNAYHDHLISQSKLTPGHPTAGSPAAQATTPAPQPAIILP